MSDFNIAKEVGRRSMPKASPVKVFRDGVLDEKATRKAYSQYTHRDPGWNGRRLRWKASECVACGATESLHLHHLTYERVGRERPSDVVTLCASCHASVHAKHRKSPSVSLAIITHRYIGAYLARRERAG